MARKNWNVIYIDRNPDNPDEGWGWVEVLSEDIKRFSIPHQLPVGRWVTKHKEVTVTRYKDSVPYTETYTNTYTDYLNVPSRGRAAGKKFTLNINGELITIKAQKSLTINAVSAWLWTWASPETKIVTPGNRSLSFSGEKLTKTAHFVYFILNEDSNAIKIGRAKNLEQRMKSLQTSSPTQLKLIKSVQVEGVEQAQDLEQSLHQQFQAIRLVGEWFQADASLIEYISQI
ncbi:MULTISPECIES: GIY-YIG nuclease family protein [unclassified Nodularia (in: cyanobacteria)]|uniref:GIY-YIG nuclease family protein n=1 Tax=unclassified Nodularia (in: cyanobacteria) TaxID=2656917 RepID=UPI00188267FC|nr:MULTISPECIES: GIY-YIG nuclease family protein [unclassified Nodularia (in: cyanobacteria)]MBE9202056.1 GIY-YIG nuclease family protein [Nodularia sp. LEGE 06071]MCC2694490.1 GIY-YIG nuclease family protein [Nodularia sp. LEGE 04288]